jgi:hypothetical protein
LRQIKGNFKSGFGETKGEHKKLDWMRKKPISERRESISHPPPLLIRTSPESNLRRTNQSVCFSHPFFLLEFISIFASFLSFCQWK